LKNTSDAPISVPATLHHVEHIWSYDADPGEPIATTTLTVAAGGPHWVDWNVDLDADALGDTPGYVRIDLAATDDVEWVVSPHVLPGQIAAYENSPGRYRRFPRT
jgi:hypothetical protein